MKRLPRFDLLDDRPGHRPGWWLLALGLLALAALLASPASRSRLHDRLTEPSHARIAAARAPLPSTLQPASLPGEDAAAHLADRSTAWAELFAIQATHGQGSIELLTLKPDLDAGRLHLVAEAADLQAMLAWLHDLESDPRLDGVALTRHEWREAVTRTGTPAALRFEIEARWPARRPQAQRQPSGSIAARLSADTRVDRVQRNVCG